MIFLKFNDRNDNLGDQLIFKCLYDEISKYGKVFLMSSSPYYIRESPLRFRKAFFTALKAKILGQQIMIIDPPGARFIPKAPIRLNLAQRIRGKITMLLWNLLDTKFKVTGISVDPAIDIREFTHYSLIGARDMSSLKILSALESPVRFCPDMSLLRTPRVKTSNITRAILSFRSETPDNAYNTSYSTKLAESTKDLIEAAKLLSIDCDFYSQVTEDNQFNKNLAAHNGCRMSREIIVDFDYQSFLEEYQIVISNRLHVLLPAMSEGLIPIAFISRDHIKIIELFKSYGMENCIFYIDEISNIETHFSRILANADQIRENQFDVLKELRTNTEDFIRDFIEQ